MPQFISMTELRARKTVLTMLIPIGSEAAGMMPRETGTMINSLYRDVVVDNGVVRGRVGFTTEYAGFVHEAPGKLLGKGVKRASGKGVVWGPSGEPQFLKKGAEQAQPLVERALRGGMKL